MVERHKHYCLKMEHVKKQRLEKKLRDQSLTVAGGRSSDSVSSSGTIDVDTLTFRPK
ncbi:unnamed protein product, partial [Anisakis simplex]|uniref:Uncharacterized protein n=1 Tax=Anisakis simplex TaxID=6269 RepID=A0A0M3JP92_ANISI